MKIYPAIDIKGGRCVRLVQGRMDAETVYSDDPVEVALRWRREGGAMLHIVDLDGAVEGGARNFETIEAIVKAVDIPVQVGGGIRDRAAAERYLSLDGVGRIIIGTAALERPGFVEELARAHPGRIAVGIDAKDGRVAVKGWVEVTGTSAVELARRLDGAGAACIIYTDIARDGMLGGPNVEATRGIVEAVDIPVVASGGISSLADIESYRGVGVEGIIIGKALYTGDVRLADAVAAAARG
ncbi:MAG TPA: 1-(5-phosphoribosyl)-5-[(5-phosphoribosylamino)methylideneamino]imidazole-4-carboxamide isomerase [Deltaproteobacteria bacterium]|nr:1-(5-phosphoribosyl)-5-[(5-phosphoribosylamino)methylideneamino]imidazole-4-carboxamide isomerase [Deltaproteobacteria bacterium]